MLKKYPFLLSIAFVLMAMSTLPAKANILTSATATVNCQGYNLTVNATDLTVGTTYTIDDSFTLTCGSAPPRTIPGSITFTASAATESVAATASFGSAMPTGSCIVTGTATITSSGSTVGININGKGTSGAPLSCPSSPLTLACEPATTGTVGVPFDSCLSATGGIPPYMFSFVSGPIPPGNPAFAVNGSTGCITGTPTQAGTFTDTFEVTDSESPPPRPPPCAR
jgi:hypothetical protein